MKEAGFLDQVAEDLDQAEHCCSRVTQTEKDLIAAEML